VAGKPTAGIMKDVVAVPSRKQVEVQFVAGSPGLSLFHCHMQLHIDFGFMTLLKYQDGPDRRPCPARAPSADLRRAEPVSVPARC